MMGGGKQRNYKIHHEIHHQHSDPILTEITWASPRLWPGPHFQEDAQHWVQFPLLWTILG